MPDVSERMNRAHLIRCGLYQSTKKASADLMADDGFKQPSNKNAGPEGPASSSYLSLYFYPCGLALEVSQVVELCPSDLASADDLY